MELRIDERVGEIINGEERGGEQRKKCDGGKKKNTLSDEKNGAKNK